MIDDEHRNDIQIGDDEWIHCTPVDRRYSKAVAIDDEVANLTQIWDSLETYCAASCCGLEAFDFTSANARAAFGELGPESQSLLRRFRERISAVGGDVLSSNRLNATIYKSEMLLLVDHLIGCSLPITQN